MAENKFKTAALWYAQKMGLRVFPLKPRSKEPLVKGWPEQATDNPEKIKSWWNLNPDANVGIATGRGSGIWVLDIDGEAGDESLFALREAFGLLPETIMSMTGNGKHYFFRYPNQAEIRNSISKMGSGIDIRGEGGYIVAPPSIHPNGQAYEWEASCEPPKVPIADAPDWLFDRVKKQRANGNGGGQVANSVKSAPFGELTKVYSALAALSAENYDDWVKAGMFLHSTGWENAFDIWCQWSSTVPAKFDLKACQKKWASFHQDGGISLGTLYYRAQKQRQGTSRLESSQDDELPPPYPEFSWDTDFGIAGEVAKLAADGTEVDPCPVIFTFLTAAAALFGLNCYINVGETRHYPRLFVCIVGSSSRSRKGSSTGLIRRLIDKVNEMSSGDNRPESLSVIEGGLSSHEGLIFAIRDPSDDEDDDGNPKDKGVSDKRALIIEEEFASTLKVASRDGNALSPILRKAWDGGVMQSLTKNNRIKATDPHINLVTHITGYELRKVLVENEVQNGFANRFLWVCARRTGIVAFPKRAKDSDVQRIALRLRTALKTARSRKDLCMDAEARQRWEEIYRTVSIDEVGRAAAFTARGEAHILRMALIFALLECGETIKVKHLNAAYCLWLYSDASIRHIFCSAEGVEGDRDAQRVLTALRRRAAMTQSDMHKLFNNHKPKRHLIELLTQLEGVNKIYQDVRKGNGTKSARVWRIRA